MSTQADTTGNPPPQTIFDRQIWWLLVVGVAAICVYIFLENQAFPSASIDLKVPKSEITKISREWAQKLGYEEKGSIQSTTFSYDSDEKTFLEYELGLKRANELMKDEVPVWSWRTRMCRELNQEEFRVWVSPQGKLTSFQHDIENDKKLPTISHSDAQKIASEFIEKTNNISLAKFKLIKDQEFSEPHRKDHSFTWEDQTHDFKDAHMRYYAYVAGNMLTEYNYYLDVPEKWSRKFSTIRTYNEQLGQIAEIFYMVLQNGAMYLIFGWGVATGNIRWRYALMAGGFLGIVAGLESLNNIINVFDDYDTTQTLNAYLIKFYVSVALGTFYTVLSGIVMFGSGEAIYRYAYPKAVALENWFKGLGSWQVLNGLIAGHCVFAIHLGWVVAYYLLGSQIGFWCPLGVDNYEILSSVFPFFSAINLGVRASTSEEILYRVIGLSLAQRLTKSFWLANLFQAAAWGFMHSTYPQQPAYARGLELTLGGLLYGWIIRRYGLIPCICAHYLVDALLDVKPLMSSSDMWLRCSSLLAIIPFAIVGVIAATKVSRKTVADDSSVANETLIKPPAEKKPAETAELEKYQYQKHSNKTRLILILALSLFAFVPALLPRRALCVDAQISLPKEKALVAARDIMRAHGVPPEGWQEYAYLSYDSGGDEFQYMFEQVKWDKTREIADAALAGYQWRVRYFKWMQSEEYSACVDKDGKEYSFSITKEEDAPGASLSKEEARKRVEEYIDSKHPEYRPYEFDNVSEHKHKNRVDYSFTYKVPKLKVSEADCKISASVVGEHVGDFSRWWTVPDKWTFEREKRTLKDEIAGHTYTALSFIMALLGLWWGFGVLRSGAIKWRPAVIVSVPIALLIIPDILNDLPNFYRSYGTTTPQTSYIIEQVVGDLRSFLGRIVQTFMLAALSYGTYRLLFPKTPITSVVDVAFRQGTGQHRIWHYNMWLDAVIIGYSYYLVSTGISTIGDRILMFISPQIQHGYLGTICALPVYFFFPLDRLTTFIDSSLTAACSATIVAGVYAKYVPTFAEFLKRRFSPKSTTIVAPGPIASFWVFFSILLLHRLVSNAGTRYWQDFVVGVASGLIGGLLYWYLIKHLAKNNILAYASMTLITVIFPYQYGIYRHSPKLFTADFAILSVMLLSPIIYLIYLRLRLPKEELALTTGDVVPAMDPVNAEGTVPAQNQTSAPPAVEAIASPHEEATQATEEPEGTVATEATQSPSQTDEKT